MPGPGSRYMELVGEPARHGAEFVALGIWSFNHNIILSFRIVYHVQVTVLFICENLAERSSSLSLSSPPQCLATCFALTRYSISARGIEFHPLTSGNDYFLYDFKVPGIVKCIVFLITVFHFVIRAWGKNTLLTVFFNCEIHPNLRNVKI